MAKCKHPRLTIREWFDNYQAYAVEDGKIISLDNLQGNPTDDYQFICRDCGMDRIYKRGRKKTPAWASAFIQRIVNGEPNRDE